MLKTVVALVAIVLVVLVVLRLRQPPIGEVAPAGELRGPSGGSAEDYPQIEIDPANVPEDLRDLIPIAEAWGIGDDVIRGDHGESASPEQKERFKAALTGNNGVTYKPGEETDGVSYDEADDAVNQPRLEFLALIGLSFRFGE